MKIPDKVIDQIFEEVKKELKEKKPLNSDKPETFHDIEGSILELRQHFSQRLAEAVLKYQESESKKKTVRNARRKRKATENEIK